MHGWVFRLDVGCRLQTRRRAIKIQNRHSSFIRTGFGGLGESRVIDLNRVDDARDQRSLRKREKIAQAEKKQS